MSTGRIQFAEQDGTFVLKFVGEVRLTLCSALDATIERIFTALNFSAIVIDLTETRSIDSTTLGLLAKLSILSRQKVGLLPTVVTTHEDITRLLQSMGFDQVFNIVDRPIPCPECLTDLPSQDQSEEIVRIKVLEAHKILMGLNESNREAFHDLVNAIERDGPPCWDALPKCGRGQALAHLTEFLTEKKGGTLTGAALFAAAAFTAWQTTTLRASLDPEQTDESPRPASQSPSHLRWTPNGTALQSDAPALHRHGLATACAPACRYRPPVSPAGPG